MFTIYTMQSLITLLQTTNLKTKMFISHLTICIVEILSRPCFSRFVSVNSGIPLWFRCFKGKENPEAFKTSLIIEGISYVKSLFKNKDCNLIFLADRWFPNCETMDYIDSIGATYCIRAKGNTLIHIDNFEYADVVGSITEIEPYLTKSKFFDSVQITKNNFQTKLAVSKAITHNEPFFILTNGNTREAIKQYGYRFRIY